MTPFQIFKTNYTCPPPFWWSPIPLTKSRSTFIISTYSSPFDTPTSSSPQHTSPVSDIQHQNPSTLPLHSPSSRPAKTRYHIRQQPKIDNRTFIPSFKFYPPWHLSDTTLSHFFPSLIALFSITLIFDKLTCWNSFFSHSPKISSSDISNGTIEV